MSTLPTRGGTQPVIAVRDISKRFGTTQALVGCDLEIRAGEVHGFVGANGAGKSTLVKILSGAIGPDAGEIRVGEWDGASLNPRLAQELGIATIYQEPDLVPTLHAAENIALGREHRRGRVFLDRNQERLDASAAGARVGLSSFALSRPIEDLSRADQQLVEVAKALHRQVRVILMDEPTAPLGPRDVGRLETVIRDLAAHGVAVLYISHRLREVLRVCNQVSVIRDGRRVWTRPARELTESAIVQAMIGHGLEHVAAPSAQAGNVLLDVEALGQSRRLVDVSLALRAGEIVGLAGLVGAGRSRLLRALVGEERPDRGKMTLKGKPYAPHSPAAALRRGVGLVPEDRKTQGLFLEQSVVKNLTFSRPLTYAAGLVRLHQERAATWRWIERLSLTPRSPGATVKNLSGGNQQKVILARWLHADVDVLLVDEPGQGIDVSAKEDVYQILRETARSGKAILTSCSESEDLFTLADRILVMRLGRIVGEFERGTATEEQIVALASGATSERNQTAEPPGT
jgi:ABC-type sugar transport system ATPase subunit